MAVFSKPAAEAEAAQSEDRLLALSSTATPVPGRGQWPLSPDVVYAALNEKDPETLRRKHTFSSLLKAYEKKSESFQKAQVFLDESSVPQALRRWLVREDHSRICARDAEESGAIYGEVGQDLCSPTGCVPPIPPACV